MSETARWLIAITGLVFAAGFVAFPFIAPPESLAVNGFIVGAVGATICLLISLLCFPGPARPIAARLIGAAVFAAYAFYLVDMIRTQPHLTPTDHPGHTDLKHAIVGFVVIGVPAAYVAVTGSFPRWTVLKDRLHHNS